MRKILCLLAVLLVLLMIGCKQAPEAPESAPEAEPTEPEIVEPELEEPEPVPLEEPTTTVGKTTVGGKEATEGVEDVVFKGRDGFEPTEITVAKGSTLGILIEDEGSAEYQFGVVEITGLKTIKVGDGQIAELTLEDAGEFTVMDMVFKKKLAVTVE